MAVGGEVGRACVDRGRGGAVRLRERRRLGRGPELGRLREVGNELERASSAAAAPAADQPHEAERTADLRRQLAAASRADTARPAEAVAAALPAQTKTKTRSSRCSTSLASAVNRFQQLGGAELGVSEGVVGSLAELGRGGGGAAQRCQQLQLTADEQCGGGRQRPRRLGVHLQQLLGQLQAAPQQPQAADLRHQLLASAQVAEPVRRQAKRADLAPEALGALRSGRRRRSAAS